MERLCGYTDSGRSCSILSFFVLCAINDDDNPRLQKNRMRYRQKSEREEERSGSG